MSPPGEVILLCGAPGTGKSRLLPELVKAAGPMVVVDLDELPDDGCVLGVPVVGPAGEPNWEAYESLWLRIIGLITRAGHSVLVLCQIPSLKSGLPSSTPQGVPVTWCLLDCPDDARSRRLAQRGWSAEDIAEATRSAEAARATIPARILGGPDEPSAELAHRIVDSLLSRLQEDTVPSGIDVVDEVSTNPGGVGRRHHSSRSD